MILKLFMLMDVFQSMNHSGNLGVFSLMIFFEHMVFLLPLIHLSHLFLPLSMIHFIALVSFTFMIHLVLLVFSHRVIHFFQLDI